ncbi:MAG: hypothetical protein ACYCXK_03115 [Candidatus Humimicrobiaceae bacterium]
MEKAVSDLRIRVKSLKGSLEEGYKIKLNKFAEEIINSLSAK